MSRRKNAKTPGQLFLSHTNRVRRDKNYALCLKRALEHLGLKVFLDNEYTWGGKTLPEGISRELEKSDYYVPLLSLQALKRPWVDYEIDLAVNLRHDSKTRRRLVIVPFFLEDCRNKVPKLLPYYPVWVYKRTFSEVLKDLLEHGTGLHLSVAKIDSAAQLYAPQKPTLNRWLIAIAPNNYGNPFLLTPDEIKRLKPFCTGAVLGDQLTQRLQQFLHKDSLAEIAAHELQDEIDHALIEESHGVPERMFRLGYLLFHATARRWAKGDREKMLTRADWETAKRKASK